MDQAKYLPKTESTGYRLPDGKHPQKRVLPNEVRYLLHQIDINDLLIQSHLDTVSKIMSSHLLLDDSGTG